MLTGKPPFGALPPQRLLGAHLTSAPAPVESARPDCPPGLALLVSRLLQKDPADRPADAQTVLRSLLAWAAATLVVWIVARAAVVGIGLPSWTVTGAVGVMLLGLPVLLATG